MNRKSTLQFPSFRQIAVLLFGLLFLTCLGVYLLGGPLEERLAVRKPLLIVALSATGVLLVVGSLYSHLHHARIQSYLCAVCMLMGIGFAYQFFFGEFSKFVSMVFLGTAAGLGGYFIYRRINILNDRLFWLCTLSILGLLANNVLFGERINGAKLWVKLGAFMFQPGELIKVLLILLGASSFQNPRRSAVYCLVSLLSCGVLLLLRDLGGVVVIFALFMLMVYLLFDNRLLSIAIIAAAVVALVVALGRMPYAAARFENWGHAMENPDSYQQRQFITAILMGGFKGLGVADNSLFTRIYAAANDGALVGVMAVLGIPMILITLGAYALLASQAALNHSVYTSNFLIHAQMGFYIVVHVLLNFAGAADVLPFTGVVSPLISSGGSATLCFGLLLGLGAAALNPHLEYYTEE